MQPDNMDVDAKPNSGGTDFHLQLHWSHAPKPPPVLPPNCSFIEYLRGSQHELIASQWLSSQSSQPNSTPPVVPDYLWRASMKRVADEAITKEHGATPNTDAVQSSTSKMATAAQRAARKIAPLRKSRVGQGSRATTPTGPSAPSILDQPQQSSFMPSTGFQFGSNTASSFPPSHQPSFDFGAPSSASSFTFGQSNTSSQQNNPFASVNGSIGGINQNDNIMMDDSPQKAASSGSLFQFGNNASNNSQNKTSANGFIFGQPTQEQKSTGGFGNNLFGQQKPSQDPPSKNPFASLSQPSQQNGITSTAGLFGQASQPATSAPSSAPLFAGFGAPATTTSALASTSEPVFSFGQPSTTKSPSTQTEQSTPFSGFSFGKPASDSESTTAKPTFSFGQPASSSATPIPSVTTETSAPSLFTTKKSDPVSATTSTNSFGIIPTPLDQQRQQQPVANQESDDGQPTGPKNPFASLFAAKPTTAASTETSKTVASPFKFGNTNTFAPSQKTLEPPSKPAESAADQSPAKSDTPVFSFGQPTTSSGGLFSPKASTLSPSGPGGSLFNLNKATTSAGANEQSTKQISSQPSSSTTSSSLFNNLAQSQQVSPLERSETSSKPNSNPFGTFGQQSTPVTMKQSEPVSTDEGPAPKKRALFHSSTPATMEKTAFGSFPKSTPSAPNDPKPYKSPMYQEPSVSKEPVTRAVSTEGAPQIPRHLSGDKYKSYDENYRLRNLNRLFKDKVSEVDVDKFDVMSLIQNYLDHREAIGEGLGRYGRVKAGLKRKATDVDHLESSDDSQGKKTRLSTTSQPVKEKVPEKNSSNTTSSGLFSSFTSPKPTNVFSPSKAASDSQTPNLFRSMIPSASDSTPNLSNIFSAAAAKSTTPPSSPPKATAPQMPTFQMPKFGSNGNFLAAFAKSSADNAKKFANEAKEKRKAEDFDSDEENEEAWTKKYEEEERAKRAKIDAIAKGGFKPTFGTTSSQTSFPFGQSSANATVAKPTQAFGVSSADVRGSSQDPLDTIEHATDTADENEISGSGNSGDDEEEPVTDDLPEDEVEEENQDEEGNGEEEEEEEEGEPIPQLDPSESLFGRITGKKSNNNTAPKDQPIMQPAANNSFKPGIMFGNIGKSTPDAPTFSPFTPVTNPLPKGDFVPTTTFNFTPTPSSAPAKTWSTSSVLTGGAVRDGPIPGEGLFGSRPSTPQPQGENDVRPTSAFGTSLNGPSDNTWKRGSEIKFGTSPLKTDSTAPAVEITSATPPPKEQSKPFAGLFGESVDKSGSTNGNSSSLGFNFGNGVHSAATNAPVPGFLSAASHLGNSVPGSGISSRATSPGLTDNESIASDNTEDYSNEPQAPSLMNSNAGEEDEDVIFDTRSHIYRQYSEKDLVALDLDKEKGIGRGREKMKPGLNQKGTGSVKVLKHKDTKKCRIVFRADPGANVILNVRLLPTVNYTSIPMGKTNGAVQFLAIGEDKKMQSWMVKVKNKELSDEMAIVANENKKN